MMLNKELSGYPEWNEDTHSLSKQTYGDVHRAMLAWSAIQRVGLETRFRSILPRLSTYFAGGGIPVGCVPILPDWHSTLT